MRATQRAAEVESQISHFITAMVVPGNADIQRLRARKLSRAGELLNAHFRPSKHSPDDEIVHDWSIVKLKNPTSDIEVYRRGKYVLR